VVVACLAAGALIIIVIIIVAALRYQYIYRTLHASSHTAQCHVSVDQRWLVLPVVRLLL